MLCHPEASIDDVRPPSKRKKTTVSSVADLSRKSIGTNEKNYSAAIGVDIQIEEVEIEEPNRKTPTQSTNKIPMIKMEPCSGSSSGTESTDSFMPSFTKGMCCIT